MLRLPCALVLLTVALPDTVLPGQESVELPLTKVVLFNAGLGYFEHVGQVDGTVDVELKLDTADLNDLLKSVVVQDTGDGQIGTVSYPSSASVSERLRDYSVDLTAEPTLAELLHQLRGEEIEMDGGRLSGTIVGVELKSRAAGQQVVQCEVLTLLTEDGLRAIPVDSVGSFALANAQLERELREALQVVTSRRQAEQRQVRFHFAGQGRRQVRIGYLRETPIWKISYRIVLEKDDQSLLQGWAIVENRGDSDWERVALTLASGRPVTYRMDLDSPLLVRRPWLPPSVPASLESRVYTPDLGTLDMDRPLSAAGPVGGAGGGAPAAKTIIAPGTGMGMGMGGMGGGMGGMGGMGGGGMGGMSAFGGGGMYGFGGGGGAAAPREPLEPSQGVDAQATAAAVGEQFQYEIARPVNLARRQSALIPIVDGSIQAEKVSVYTHAADSDHPMMAFRLTNTTELQLAAGPITVFEGGAYAGDARLEYLRPAEERLINYAEDVDLKVAYRMDTEDRQLHNASLVVGVVRVEYDVRRQHNYRLQNRAEEARRLILEQPRPDPPWKLVDERRPCETTSSHYRFQIDVPAGKTVAYSVQEKRSEREEHDLRTISDKALVDLSRRIDLPADVTAVIKSVLQLRRAIADLESQLSLQQKLLSDITREQTRIRSNMASLDRNSDLYRRYVEKLTGQEDKFDTARERIAPIRARLSEARLRLEHFFPSLDGQRGPGAGQRTPGASRDDPFAD